MIFHAHESAIDVTADEKIYQVPRYQGSWTFSKIQEEQMIRLAVLWNSVLQKHFVTVTNMLIKLNRGYYPMFKISAYHFVPYFFFIENLAQTIFHWN